MTTRWEPPFPPGLSPVLDIGGEVGAIVVYLAASPPNGELEACPSDAPEARFHTGVHHRTVGHETAWVAVFPDVAEGAYDLLDDAGCRLARVAVSGGQIEQLDLR